MPLPDEIVEAGNNFTPSFRVTDELEQESYQSLWEGSFDANSGVTGLWFPTEDWMVIGRRGLTHHNNAYRSIYKEHGALSPVMPWAVGRSGESWHVDLPSSGGGMTQVLHKLDVSDEVDSWQHGGDVSAEVLWPVAYTCRLLDVPDSASVRFLYRPRSMSSADPNFHKTEAFLLEEVYTELRFTPAGLPEPTLDRQQYL